MTNQSIIITVVSIVINVAIILGSLLLACIVVALLTGIATPVSTLGVAYCVMCCGMISLYLTAIVATYIHATA